MSEFVSLLSLLRDCLPVHAAWSSAEIESKTLKGQQPPAEVLRRYVKLQTPGSFQTPVAPIPGWQLPTIGEALTHKQLWGPLEAIQTAKLWDFEARAVETEGGIEECPVIFSLNCRARQRAYARHRVADSIMFRTPKIRFVGPDDQSIGLFRLDGDLSLGPKFSVVDILVSGGKVPPGDHRLWPLECQHDQGFVRLYLYEAHVDDSGRLETSMGKRVDEEGGWYSQPSYNVHPWQPSASAWKPVNEAEAALVRALLAGSNVDNPEAIVEALTGPFMRVGGTSLQAIAKTSEEKVVELMRPRLALAVSLATCKERNDFEPGGVVGMGRVFPNLLLWSSLKVAEFSAEVMIARPAKTIVLDSGKLDTAKGATMGGCCGAVDEIGVLLVADANDTDSISQLPFWGGTFNYVATAAHERYLDKKLEMVSPERNAVRPIKVGKRLLVRRALGEGGVASDDYWQSIWEQRSIERVGGIKQPRQGDFDNIHLAPHLKLDLARIDFTVTSDIFGITTQSFAIDINKYGGGRVWMAPFCAHDCLHMHWRWGEKLSETWTQGWNEVAPFKVPGGAMVPLHQSVELTIYDPSTINYKATCHYGDRHVPGQVDVILHHGLAYAQDVTDWLKMQGSNINVGLETVGLQFFDSNGNELDLNHAPLFYWLLRYEIWFKGGDELVINDRLQFSAADLEVARQL